MLLCEVHVGGLQPAALSAPSPVTPCDFGKKLDDYKNGNEQVEA